MGFPYLVINSQSLASSSSCDVWNIVGTFPDTNLKPHEAITLNIVGNFGFLG